MSSSEPGRRRALLHCATDADILVEISDARGRKVWSDYGGGAVDLPHGLYRVDLARHGRITSEHIDLDRSIELRTFVPPIDTPAPITGAARWDAVHVEAARWIGHHDTRAPVGKSPTTSRLLVQVHGHGRRKQPTSPLSEPLTIHDRDGREIAAITPDQAHLRGAERITVLSCAVAPGTYRLRAVRTRRDVAITIPAGYAARVFAADHGAIALGDLRVSITPLDREFDPSDPVLRATEGAVAALRTPDEPLLPYGRALLATELDRDLGFAIVATHLLWRANERDELVAALHVLEAWIDIVPDLMILDALLRGRTRRLRAPPLLRGSLSLAMSHQAQISCAADDPVARAARTAYTDSVWCTWSDRRWDESWIAPTLETMRTRGHDLRVAQFASSMAIPTVSVTDAMLSINATTATFDGRALGPGDVSIPGYRLEAVLGRGGQGTVFRAQRLRDRDTVALKVVPLLDAEHARRIERGLELERSLHHKRLLTARASGVVGNGSAMWIETELCRGSVLDMLDERGAALPVPLACQCVLDALDGLAYLHAHGAVHRDIKPGNLLLRDNRDVVIADFGLAKGVAQPGLTPGWIAAGTLHFAAHEQLEDFRSAGPASDVWSMAATLYFLLTLELPRDQYAGQSDLVAALDNPSTVIRHWAPDLPIALADCIDGALSREVARRPRDGGAFRSELFRALHPPRPMMA